MAFGFGNLELEACRFVVWQAEEGDFAFSGVGRGESEDRYFVGARDLEVVDDQRLFVLEASFEQVGEGDLEQRARFPRLFVQLVERVFLFELAEEERSGVGVAGFRFVVVLREPVLRERGFAGAERSSEAERGAYGLGSEPLFDRFERGGLLWRQLDGAPCAFRFSGIQDFRPMF